MLIKRDRIKLYMYAYAKMALIVFHICSGMAPTICFYNIHFPISPFDISTLFQCSSQLFAFYCPPKIVAYFFYFETFEQLAAWNLRTILE